MTKEIEYMYAAIITKNLMQCELKITSVHKVNEFRVFVETVLYKQLKISLK